MKTALEIVDNELRGVSIGLKNNPRLRHLNGFVHRIWKRNVFLRRAGIIFLFVG
jgi:hypothetical protein